MKFLLLTLLAAYGILACVMNQEWGRKIDCKGTPVSFDVIPHCGAGWIEERF